jgi:hypothetical protein
MLALGPHLKDAVMRLNWEVLKTEPAFAKVLSMHGNPYMAFLELEHLDNAKLQEVIGTETLLRRPTPTQWFGKADPISSRASPEGGSAEWQVPSQT